ncbi:hypothetical protein BpHYR1_021715 [Brachionus plicatilis]|uniref:Uncharacterized protein n=1 Tax=Brachionus plicatilis TaxID=10195 RepID=A0A3M7T5U5_BRAPC|nr:hypothetical protein BpHYR1_021715 [Brachionus plicatilis]
MSPTEIFLDRIEQEHWSCQHLMAQNFRNKNFWHKIFGIKFCLRKNFNFFYFMDCFFIVVRNLGLDRGRAGHLFGCRRTDRSAVGKILRY